MSTWTDLVEAMKRVQEMKQVVICEPHMVLQVETLIQRSGMGHAWRVQSSPHCPAGKLILVRDVDPEPLPVAPVNWGGPYDEATLF